MAGRRILVIDDETELAMLIRTELEASRYQVMVANDGEAGLQKATQELPDLIILDIMMPKMDGYKVLRHLRENPKTRNIPVLMLSAKSETHSIFQSQELGATDYLIKPFESDDLLKAVQRYLGDATLGG